MNDEIRRRCRANAVIAETAEMRAHFKAIDEHEAKIKRWTDESLAARRDAHGKATAAPAEPKKQWRNEGDEEWWQR